MPPLPNADFAMQAPDFILQPAAIPEPFLATPPLMPELPLQPLDWNLPGQVPVHAPVAITADLIDDADSDQNIDQVVLRPPMQDTSGFAFMVLPGPPYPDDLLVAPPEVDFRDWTDFVLRVRAAQVRLIRLVVEDLTAVVFSLYEPQVVWDSYDQLMFGHLSLDRVREHGLSALLFITGGEVETWHRQFLSRLLDVLQVIARVYVSSVRAYTYYVPQGRTPSISIHHLKAILAEEVQRFLPDFNMMPLSELTLTSQFIPNLAVASFVSLTNHEYPMTKTNWNAMLLAFLSGRHSRLGAESELLNINDDCLQVILKFLPSGKQTPWVLNTWLQNVFDEQWSPTSPS